MGRGTVLERIHHAAKAFFDFVLTVACDLKRLEHDLGLVVPDGTGHQFVAVARKVILIAKHFKRVAHQRVHPTLWHRERVVFKVDLAGFFVFLVDREIDDPGKGETVFVRQTQFGTDDVAGTARDTFERLGLAAKEERRIAHVQT